MGPSQGLKMTKSDFNFLDRPNIMEKALFIRCVEEALLDAFAEGKLSGTIHTCIGQELIGVAVSENLQPHDIIFSNHRGHGHYLSVTGDHFGLISEIMGHSFGAAGGIGGSQHLYNKNYYSNGIQGSTLPVSAGCALANKIESNNGISVSFIGDGTLGQGVVYETLNIASLWCLPLLTVIENNRIAQSTDTRQNLAGSIRKRVEAFGIKFFSTNTYNLDKLTSTTSECFNYIRSSGCPVVIEIQTDRLRSHSKGDDNRDPDLITQYYERDLLSKYLLTDEGAKLNRYFKSIVSDTINAIENRKSKDIDILRDDTSLETEFQEIEKIESGVRINDQIYNGLRDVLERDPKAILLGEDIQNKSKYTPLAYGGAFNVTRDLSDLFNKRVLSTPISEAAIVGLSIGLALRGFKPVVEIMFGDFLPLAFDQLINNAAKFVEMFGKELKIPLIIRVPMGARRGYGPTHSQTLEKHFLGIKNLKIIVMNHRIDNAELIKNLFETITVPTLLIENKVLYTKFSNEEKIPGFQYASNSSIYPDVMINPKGIEPDYLIICYGQMLEEVEKALAILSREEEIYCSVLCLCDISDPNIDNIKLISNLIKGILIVEEGSDIGGISAEIISRIVEKQGFSSKRVSRLGNRKIIPCSKTIEDKTIPNALSICQIVKQDLESG